MVRLASAVTLLQNGFRLLFHPTMSSQPPKTRTGLFRPGAYRAELLDHDDARLLQAFYQRNSRYFQIVAGETARPHGACEDLAGHVPEGWPYTAHLSIGFFDDRSSLAGCALLVKDLLAASVWHLGLFMVEETLQGRGLGRLFYGALEGWAADQGADWMRLGVVVGNQPAERFWARHGFLELRLRHDMQMGQKINTVRTMAKPLTGQQLHQYLERVPRDRPDQS